MNGLDDRVYAADVLIIGIILFGMLVGAAAQYILRGFSVKIDWTYTLTSGLVGSFVGGLLISWANGDGFRLRPSGLIGSLVGAIIVTAIMGWSGKRKTS